MQIAKRRIQMVGHTSLFGEGWDANPAGPVTPEFKWYLSRGDTGPSRYQGRQGQDLIEFAGRACYQSFSRPNPKTRMQQDYMLNILQSRHFSVLEHSSVTFYLTGVSRSFTHELIRHRHLSYSQLSQRFVKSDNLTLVIPPALESVLQDEGDDQVSNTPSGTTFVTERLDDLYEAAKAAYEEIASVLEDTEGSLRAKQIREAARCVLPNMTETKIVVTGNMRAWRHFILMRATEHADLEICQVAVEIYRQLNAHSPYIFQDMKLEEKGNREVVSSPYGEEDY